MSRPSTMPAGVTWSRYIKFTIAAMLTMFAGSQTVHVLYKPLDDIEDWVEKERKIMKAEKNKSKS